MKENNMDDTMTLLDVAIARYLATNPDFENKSK